ncbi:MULTISPECIES: FadR/GntR family transcriptional regulator, partial [unclassified Proteiniphilum]
MERLRIQNNSTTLVDQVEDKLLNYFKEKDLQKGDAIPNEMELTASLGVSRSVVREALSRLKMMGIVETRTRRGMLLSEPSIFGGMKRAVDPRILSEDTLFDILGFRIVLEIGICSEIFRKITP